MNLFAEAAGAATLKATQDEQQGDKITIDRKEFIKSEKKDKIKYRNYLVVKHEKLDFPVIVYRFEENDYGALLMRCSHQGSELSVNGDILSCPAHGSEFDNKGALLQGPAEESLKIFTTTTDETNIYVHLS
jgi:Rieske Fe-S protein